jgi:hypothetical protein
MYREARCPTVQTATANPERVDVRLLHALVVPPALCLHPAKQPQHLPRPFLALQFGPSPPRPTTVGDRHCGATRGLKIDLTKREYDATGPSLPPNAEARILFILACGRRLHRPIARREQAEQIGRRVDAGLRWQPISQTHAGQPRPWRQVLQEVLDDRTVDVGSLRPRRLAARRWCASSVLILVPSPKVGTTPGISCERRVDRGHARRSSAASP